jgi:hypothetical protein
MIKRGGGVEVGRGNLRAICNLSGRVQVIIGRNYVSGCEKQKRRREIDRKRLI